MTDAPACYEHVFVTVEKVRVHASATADDAESGWHDLTLSTPRRIDLVSLTNGVLEELGSLPLPAGSYSQVRLVLAENGGSTPLANAVQPVGGALVPLRTPSAMQSGLKLQVHFTVEANRIIDLVLDFDACKSVVRAGNSGNYNLKPVVAVTPKYTAAIQGYVSTSMTVNGTTVSAQQGGTVVRSTIPDVNGKFNLAFLADGNYDIVITSDGRATAVVTNVPAAASTGVTTLNTQASAVLTPPSAMNTVSGALTVSTTPTPTPISLAVLDALQTLTGGPTILVAGTVADPDTGTYVMRLPAAAPQRAPFASAGLVFAPDTAVAGKYRVQAEPADRDVQVKPADVSAGNATVDFSYAP